MGKSSSQSKRALKTRISALKRRKRFIDYRASFEYAGKLSALISDIGKSISQPDEGIALLKAFFESDAAIFELCDDSSGMVGDVFRDDAMDLFVGYARNIEDKEMLFSLVLELLENNQYGARDELLDRAHEYLPEEHLRNMVTHFWSCAGNESDDYRKNSFYHKIMDLAQQLVDPFLFERAASSVNGAGDGYGKIEAARLYFAQGDIESALNRLQVIDGDRFYEHEQLALLKEIYQSIGDCAGLERVLRRQFNRHRSKELFEELVTVCGESRRPELRDEVVGAIMKESSFSTTDALFLLLAVGNKESAVDYTLSRRYEIDGNFYAPLLELIKEFEAEKLFLAATVLYRALIESILKRSQSKYYVYAVRYLKKCEKLAADISEWKDVEPHNFYFLSIKKQHQRKSSLWKRYDGSMKR